MLTLLALRTLAASLLLVTGLPAAVASDAAAARVMLFGTFHFANPGRDMVKGDVLDVTTAANQQYLDHLAARLARFEPTDVLVECSPSVQGKIDQRFGDYLAERYELPANEIYQIGFRVAKLAGLGGVRCFDEDQIGWNAQPMFDYMEAHDAAAKRDLDALYVELTQTHNREQATLSLQQLLQLANDPSRDALNKSLYLRTNAVGVGDGFAGADASASWWHRNFRMYANVQAAAAPTRRVFVLAGQGHTAILRDLLAIDDRRIAEDVRIHLAQPGSD